MAETINVNNLSLCHKGSGGMSMATIPDVCKTPSPGGPVPIPYPNIAMESDLAKGTTTIKADGGNMCANYGSEFSKSTGDEPGTVGGVTSSVNMKEATWITYSFDVKLEGKAACRLTDKMFHNHQNTVNAGGDVHAPVVVPPNPCKELAKQAQEGDVVMRSTPGDDSNLIRKLGNCEFSHSGIVTKNAAGKLVVVDAYPGRGPDNKKAVGEESVEDFFCSQRHDPAPPDKGQISRPKDPAVAKKAADWARDQIKNPDYKFNIFSDWKANGNDLYCSDFVHRAFQNAGEELVPSKMDFLSSANKKNTIDGVRDFAKTGAMGGKAKAGAYVTSDAALEKKIRSQIATSEYITPCQVGNNASMTKVGGFP